MTNPILFISVTAILWAAPISGAAHFTSKIHDLENAAQRLGRDLSVLVSYDERMLAAARHLGIPVASPR